MGLSVGEITEISSMLATMYKRFGVEHGLTLETPDSFSLADYQREIDQLESSFNTHFNMRAIITREKRSLTQQFFETVAAQVRRTFENLNRDIEHWLRAVMNPLETHVREHQTQLKRRLESIKRINEATDGLEDRIADLSQSRSTLASQLAELLAIRDRMQDCLTAGGSRNEGEDLAEAA
jgi:chromosome segregation ATPase